jgi:hypothetical protein
LEEVISFQMKFKRFLEEPQVPKGWIILHNILQKYIARKSDGLYLNFHPIAKGY